MCFDELKAGGVRGIAGETLLLLVLFGTRYIVVKVGKTQLASFGR